MPCLHRSVGQSPGPFIGSLFAQLVVNYVQEGVRLKEDGQDLVSWGMTFMPPYGASCLLGRGSRISEASLLMLRLIAS